MERTAKSDQIVAQPGNMASAVQPASSAEFNNPQVMASFLSELSEIRSQLAKAKEAEAVLGPVTETQAHITQQVDFTKIFMLWMVARSGVFRRI